MTSRWGNALPKELLQQVLSCLPNKDQMQAAAVCTQWQQVADAACVDIDLQSVSETQWHMLQQWLPKRGLGVSSLILRLQPQHSIYQLQLPPKLCSLHLQGGSCNAPWQAWLPREAAASLTRLVLQQQVWARTAAPPYQCPEQQQLLQEIRGFTSLQELKLNFRNTYGTSSLVGGHLQVLEAVSVLQHLTSLELQGLGESQHQLGAQQQYLAQLTKLQRLDVELPDTRCLGAIDRLTGLTGLSLSASTKLLISAGASSRIEFLTNLRSLVLKNCMFSAGTVPVLTALTSLHLASVPCAAALQLLGQLPLLAAVTIVRFDTAHGVAPAAYAAITHSPHLQQLNLSESGLPDAAWPHIFPAGRHLHQLHSLWLSKGCPLAGGVVQALAQCCPALVHLDGGGVLSIEPGLSRLTRLTQLHARQACGKAQAAALGSLLRLQILDLTPSRGSRGSFKKWLQWDFQPLLQLPLLTRLEVGGYLSDCSAAIVLSRLVGLADLTVKCLTEDQLRRMTALTTLTSISFDTDELGMLLVDRLRCLHAGTSRRGGRVIICNKAPAGAPPDVTSQLAGCFVCDQQQQKKLVELSRQVGDLTSQVSNLTSQVGDLTSQVDQYSSQVDNLQRERQQLKSNVGELQLQLLQQQQQLVLAQADRKALQKQLQDANAANTQIQQWMQQGMLLTGVTMGAQIMPTHQQQPAAATSQPQQQQQRPTALQAGLDGCDPFVDINSE